MTDPAAAVDALHDGVARARRRPADAQRRLPVDPVRVLARGVGPAVRGTSGRTSWTSCRTTTWPTTTSTWPRRGPMTTSPDLVAVRGAERAVRGAHRARGRVVLGRAGRVRGRHRAVRVRQVDAAARPGGPRARRGGGVGRRGRGCRLGTDGRRATAWMPQGDSLLPWRRALPNALVGARIAGQPRRRRRRPGPRAARGVRARRVRARLAARAVRGHAAAPRPGPHLPARAGRCCCSTSPSVRSTH